MRELLQEEAKVCISVSEDYQVVTLCLLASQEDVLTVADVEQILLEHGICSGIKREVIASLLEGHCVGTSFVVAEGIKKENGKDGYYEFFFNTAPTPDIMTKEDGSIDFQNIRMFEPVKNGQVIARYHRATNGISGIDVRGNRFLAKPGIDLPGLRGNFFHVNADGTEYTATLTGKIERIGTNTLVIAPVFEISGCVDSSMGRVTFEGDIVVHMDVMPGSVMEASGSIFVEGSVESAILKAGKDIVIRKGMQGSDCGRLFAGGRIMARFMEAAQIEAKRDVHANAIMDCEIRTEGVVHAIGSYGVIVGGCVFAKGGVVASEIGNPGKVCTRIEVGNTKKEAQILRLLGYRYASIQKERNRLRKIVQDFEEQAVEMLRKGEVVFEQKERSGAAKLLSQEEQKMRRIRSCLEWRTQKNHEAGNVEIRALRTIFAGSTVVVNGITKYIQETEHEASIRSNDSGLILYHR